ncbi:MAG TPA: hypothetical protein VLR46_02135 [Candidatus Dormibacteraeota bacterium]|nr:hypothetical protein [Candidatus Dormibacteraeota bacterium]
MKNRRAATNRADRLLRSCHGQSDVGQGRLQLAQAATEDFHDAGIELGAGSGGDLVERIERGLALTATAGGAQLGGGGGS